MHSKSGPDGTLYHYGLCELAQRQAVLMRKDIPSDRAIKSDRAKVVMTAGCISITFDISNYIYNSKERKDSANQNLRYNNHIANTAIEEIKNTMFEPNIVFLCNSLFEKL